jgi:hypothetical protein
MPYVDYVSAQFKQLLFALPGVLLLIFCIRLFDRNYTLNISIISLALIVIAGLFVRAFIDYKLEKS